MADRYLLESSAVDGYLLEDGSGVLLLEALPSILFTPSPITSVAGTVLGAVINGSLVLNTDTAQVFVENVNPTVGGATLFVHPIPAHAMGCAAEHINLWLNSDRVLWSWHNSAGSF